MNTREDGLFLYFLFVFGNLCQISTCEHLCNWPVNKQQCDFQIDQDSIQSMKADWKDSNSLVAKFKINLLDLNGYGAKYSKTNDTILPLDWIIVPMYESKGNLITGWPVDYWLYSFGLLDSKTLKNLTMGIYIPSSRCPKTVFGGNITVCRLIAAFSRTKTDWPWVENKYKKTNAYWCYFSEYPGVRESGWYSLKKYFGLTLRMFGYKCCSALEKQERYEINCEDKYNIEFNECQLLPYYFGIVFFCYFPIMLTKCSARAMKSGKKIHNARQRGYEDLDTDNQWLYLNKRSPLTIASIFLSVGGVADKHPLVATRIRRVIFVIGLPILVYAQIAMYYVGWPELVPALVKNRIPFGFPTILGGVSESMELFLPMFGGPLVALLTYFATGIIVLIIPSDHGYSLEMGLPTDNQTYWSLLCMNITTLEKYSSKECLNRQGYHKFHAVLRSSVFMLMNPKFWVFVLCFQAERWKRVFNLKRHLNTFVFISIFPFYILAFLLYIIFCIVEVVCMILYYGVPVVIFLFVCGRGYARSLHNTFKQKRRCFVNLIVLIVLMFHLYFLFMSCLIILTSFNFLTNIIFFVYLSIVIFPNNSFTVVYSFLMLLFFAYRIGSEVETDYFDLLYETVKAVRHTEHSRHHVNSSKGQSGYEMINIYDSMHNVEIIRERKKLPGIPKNLFNFVIRKHRPLHITIFLSILQIGLMAFLVLTSIIFVSKYVISMRTDESNELFHVLSALLITILPNLVHNFFTEKVNHKVRKLKLRQTVIEYKQTLI